MLSHRETKRVRAKKWAELAWPEQTWYAAAAVIRGEGQQLTSYSGQKHMNEYIVALKELYVLNNEVKKYVKH